MTKWEILNNLYLNKGLKIFPVKENGKTPILEEWQKECSSDFMQVLYWYETAKNCNWGLPATQNDLFIIDIDMHEVDGIKNFSDLLSMLNIDNIETLMQSTYSGGGHIIFKTDDDLRNVANNSNVFKDFPGIDIRTDGYIVVEPSRINDRPYQMVTNYEPQQMPQKLKDYILKTVSTKEEKKRTPYEKPKEVFIGNRDIALFEYINNLYFKTKLDYDEILLLAEHFNEDTFEKPLSNKVVKYKVNKVFEKDRGQCIFIRLGETDNE